MAIQIAGNTVTNIAEVETNTKALRTVIRPDDYGTLGMYKVGYTSGSSAAGVIMPAALASSSIIFAYRNTTTNNYLVKQVLLSVISSSVGFTAGESIFNLYAARSFSASDTGGFVLTPTSNSNKLRTSMATTGIGDLRISSSAALGAGTRTLDTNPLASVVAGVGTATFTNFISPQTVLLDQRAAEYPLVCVQNEGFEIAATVPATGVWQFSVNVHWEELSSGAY